METGTWRCFGLSDEDLAHDLELIFNDWVQVYLSMYPVHHCYNGVIWA
jgi:hypothetical protein